MSIAFTLGEPAGIGPDLAIIYAQQKARKNLLVLVIRIY
jgi:4-hydroxythreonine-4-phosphate dehydrogenase (EC 1.1.1.262)